MHSQAVCSGEAENNINKSDPCGAADVFLISLCSAIESWNWLSLQHLPNSEVCAAAAEQKQSPDQMKQKAENRFPLWGAWIGGIANLLKPNVYPRDASKDFRVCLKVLCRAQTFMEQHEGVPQGTLLRFLTSCECSL